MHPILRSYQTSDLEAAIALYCDAALVTGGTAYSPAQAAAWARYAEDRAAFSQALQQGTTLVAIANGSLAAFGQLHPDHHLALLYTASQFGRQGYGTQVYQALEAIARERQVPQLHTQASRIARPFFLKMGFQVQAREEVEREGQKFERFVMVKPLLG